jgi:hypothetical protein
MGRGDKGTPYLLGKFWKDTHHVPLSPKYQSRLTTDSAREKLVFDRPKGYRSSAIGILWPNLSPERQTCWRQRVGKYPNI